METMPLDANGLAKSGKQFQKFASVIVSYFLFIGPCIGSPTRGVSGIAIPSPVCNAEGGDVRLVTTLMSRRYQQFDPLLKDLQQYASDLGFVLIRQTYTMAKNRSEAIFGTNIRVVQRGYFRCSRKSGGEESGKCTFSLSFTNDFDSSEYYFKKDSCWEHNHNIRQATALNGIRLVRLENELTSSQLEYMMTILPTLRGARARSLLQAHFPLREFEPSLIQRVIKKDGSKCTAVIQTQ